MSQLFVTSALIYLSTLTLGVLQTPEREKQLIFLTGSSYHSFVLSLFFFFFVHDREAPQYTKLIGFEVKSKTWVQTSGSVTY